jgi:transposase
VNLKKVLILEIKNGTVFRKNQPKSYKDSAMPQQLLPLIPTGATQISDMVSVYRNDQRWTYYVGTLPVYYHDSGDSRMFKLVTAQMIEAGLCRQIDIIRTFGVSKNSVIRAVNKLRQGGIEAFFKKRQGRKGGKVLTAKVLGRAQDLLDQGYNRRQVAQELGVKYDTLRKALKDGRLTESDKNEVSVSKSSRTTADMDAAQGLGVACTRTDERTLASLGRLVGASVDFQTCLDVPKAGVLCAIPALLSNGLFEGAEQMLGKVSGYYTVFHILLLLALMALCRIKTCEQLRGQAPGEFGKLLGLDRIPEVRCLRNKMQQLSTDDHAKKWAAHLSSYWMQQEPEAVGTLCIDGHVRLYHGNSKRRICSMKFRIMNRNWRR